MKKFQDELKEAVSKSSLKEVADRLGMGGPNVERLLRGTKQVPINLEAGLLKKLQTIRPKSPTINLEESFISNTTSGGFRGVVFSFDQAAQAFAVERCPDAVLCVSVPRAEWVTNTAQAKAFFTESK